MIKRLSVNLSTNLDFPSYSLSEVSIVLIQSVLSGKCGGSHH